MATITGFAPVAATDARVLILGSMPSMASLDVQQYYAHPRNHFWPIMAELLSFSVQIPYMERLERLRENQIALWDVLQNCHRPGSLDTAIKRSSIVVNEFSAFYQQHHRIGTILFNGAEAERTYRTRVLPTLPDPFIEIARQRLPSTSPANAQLTLAKKCAEWRVLLDRLRA